MTKYDNRHGIIKLLFWFCCSFQGRCLPILLGLEHCRCCSFHALPLSISHIRVQCFIQQFFFKRIFFSVVVVLLALFCFVLFHFYFDFFFIFSSLQLVCKCITVRWKSYPFSVKHINYHLINYISKRNTNTNTTSP